MTSLSLCIAILIATNVIWGVLFYYFNRGWVAYSNVLADMAVDMALTLSPDLTEDEFVRTLLKSAGKPTSRGGDA